MPGRGKNHNPFLEEVMELWPEVQDVDALSAVILELESVIKSLRVRLNEDAIKKNPAKTGQIKLAVAHGEELLARAVAERHRLYRIALAFELKISCNDLVSKFAGLKRERDALLENFKTESERIVTAVRALGEPLSELQKKMNECVATYGVSSDLERSVQSLKFLSESVRN